MALYGKKHGKKAALSGKGAQPGKAALSGFDLHFLVEELKQYEGSRIDKVYHPEKKTVLLSLFRTGHGKSLLRLAAPSHLCITAQKEAAGEHTQFCALLRKHLSGARVTEISQPCFERVVQITAEKREETVRLIAEFFSRGNSILCREDGSIISIAEARRWRDRTLRGGVKYELPPSRLNILTATDRDWVAAVAGQDRETVRILATDLGLGGKYAEELCALSGIDKRAKNLDEKDAKRIQEQCLALLKKRIEPMLLLDAAGNAEDVLPFSFISRKGREMKKPSFNNAVDDFFSQARETKSDRAIAAFEKRLKSVGLIEEEQLRKKDELEAAIEENRRKAELLFEKYRIVSEILEQIRKAREKHSWKEIKDRLKGHKIVKDIDPATGKITIEL